MTAASVTPTASVARAADVHVCELDGEKVLYVAGRRSLHHLNTTASLVWDCLLPAAPVADIAEDLAQAFGADRRRVQADVSAVISQLLASGAVFEARENAQPARPREETSQYEHG